ncbi:MAG: hypothetical protein PHV08_03060 [Sulfurovaceae bacterium]|nr:hypothetical protein [Sulfurovaceae bacterium]
MSKVLYLHIGNHKTGTTSIQHALLDNRHFLESHNISFFSEHTSGGNVKTGNTSAWVYVDPEHVENGAGGYVKDVNKLALKLGNLPYDTVIMSAESLSFIFKKRHIQNLYDALKKYFNQIKIIVYLRRQDEQVISHHQQESKAGTEVLFFGTDNHAIPQYTEHHHYYMDYYERISLWADVFGDNNMIVKNFDKNKLKEHDVVADFFSIFDLHVPKKETYTLNESNGFEKTKVGHLLNRYIQNKQLRLHLFNHLSNEGKMLSSRPQAQEYYKIFQESNKKLEERFEIQFNENFDKYPATEQDIWDEDTANSAISNLLMAINDYDKNIKKNCFKSFFICIRQRLICLKYNFIKPKKYSKMRSCL